MKRLVCPPDFFDIEYEINPWMDTNIRVDKTQAFIQWHAFLSLLRELGDDVEIIEADSRCPDMTFSGDAGLVINKTFVPSNFRVEERRLEVSHYVEWFRERNYSILKIDPDIKFEGLGDIVFHQNKAIFGHGVRSDIRSLELLSDLVPDLNIVCHMKIIDDRFFHLAMALSFIDENTVLYFPQAFDDVSRATLRAAIPNVIEASEVDATRYFACNNLVLGNKILIDNATPELETQLMKRGYHVVRCDMSEFKKSGGSLRCLVLSFIETAKGNSL